jgi:hypothetical protein
MVVLDGEQVVYAWKDLNSRGFGHGRIIPRGVGLYVEPWPGVSLLLEPLPGDLYQITYERAGRQSVAHLDAVPQQ